MTDKNLEGYKSFYFNEGYEKGRKDMLNELFWLSFIVAIAAFVVWGLLL